MLGAALSPGNPQANLYFTLYGSNTVGQARGLTEDLKLGRKSGLLRFKVLEIAPIDSISFVRCHLEYTKLPPRATFIVQSIGTVIGYLSCSNFADHAGRSLTIMIMTNRAILQYSIMKQLISQHRDIFLSVQGTNIWSGQQVQTYNSLVGFCS